MRYRRSPLVTWQEGCVIWITRTCRAKTRQPRRSKVSTAWAARNRHRPKRCLLTFSEFTLKEFERDKEGNRIDEIPDGNDHSIDAVRYAMLDDILRG